MAVSPRLRPSAAHGFECQIDAPAKVNPLLHVLGRRDDGYHDLQVGFELLDWGDRIHFNADVAFTVDGIDGLAMEANLVTQAARALALDAGIVPRGHLRIDKRTPQGAGLGGGSSDAASALLLLRDAWALATSDEALSAIGLKLGADVPVFLTGRGAIGRGVGERLTPMAWPRRRLLLCFSGTDVPTAKIFQDKGLTRTSDPITIRAALDGHGHNDCEPVCRRLFPEVERLFVALAPFQPSLSGTGGTVFVEIHDPDQFDQVKAALPDGTQFQDVSTTEYSSAIKS
ncbi:4-(cytidine 5'-diphospho)-2-C-methyl-D-erythritol kinase [Litorivicinus lipolyticus]|uniref:4-diphosphocytidyl-2-C-methyl-D-erythritol kinase n=1 Tax=Litorivicinus lipolyticus TaxID=418701 RepID=A0A5Q2QG52_9GAMM|nr:4-(cytidine 5'-diphospho)-2-C-methyl-D-erythritol kinase [Litorivicinus lipolyticus]QGG81006.1 4-(cytidine 5'-diphospho)-2-C-methyl-D-erythritol kinase [Litorivicinus lipolyticus]